jgi:hypothetical protein
MCIAWRRYDTMCYCCTAACCCDVSVCCTNTLHTDGGSYTVIPTVPLQHLLWPLAASLTVYIQCIALCVHWSLLHTETMSRNVRMRRIKHCFAPIRKFSRSSKQQKIRHLKKNLSGKQKSSARMLIQPTLCHGDHCNSSCSSGSNAVVVAIGGVAAAAAAVTAALLLVLLAVRASRTAVVLCIALDARHTIQSGCYEQKDLNRSARYIAQKQCLLCRHCSDSFTSRSSSSSSSNSSSSSSCQYQ